MYELGAAVAGLISLGTLVFNLAVRLTTLGANLKTLDMRNSIFTGQPVPIGSRSFLVKLVRAFLWLLSTIVSILFSWVSVAILVGMLLYRRSKDAGTPQAVKEFRWRMRNVPMSRQQMDQEAARLGEHFC
jgi:hypothetical protein